MSMGGRILKEISNFNNLNNECENIHKEGKVKSYFKLKKISNIILFLSYLLSFLIVFAVFSLNLIFLFKFAYSAAIVFLFAPILYIFLNHFVKKITKYWNLSDYLNMLNKHGYDLNEEKDYIFIQEIKLNINNKSQLNCSSFIKQIKFLDERILNKKEKKKILSMMENINGENHYTVPIMLFNKEIKNLSTILKKYELKFFEKDIKERKDNLMDVTKIDIINDFAIEEKIEKEYIKNEKK